jgi:hypothetical protein
VAEKTSNIMKTKFFTIAILLFSSALFSQVPQTMGYSGKLTDGNGSFINGQVNITFRLYGTQTGGTALWEETQTGVNLSNGFFHVQLGSATSFPSGLFNNTDLWLGTEVNTDGEMAPRSKLATVAFSQKSNDGNPVGSIQAYMGTTAPEGWLICNGQSIATGDEYAELRAIIGNNVPDMRGMFLRGTGTNGTMAMAAGGNFTGPGIGGYQDDSFQGYSKNLYAPVYGTVTSGNPGQWGGDFTRSNVGAATPSYLWYTVNYNDDGHGTPRVNNETRPASIGVNYIVKY